jgi:hypothetical protein
MRTLAPTLAWASLGTFLFFVLFNLPGYGMIDQIKRASEYGKTEILDTRFGYTPDQAYVTLKNLSPEGRKRYQRMLWVDLLFPLVYVWFLWAAMGRWVIPNLSFALPSAWLIPLLVGIADWGENGIILYLIHDFPDFNESLGRAAGVLTRFKLAGFLFCIALAILGWLKAGKRHPHW